MGINIEPAKYKPDYYPAFYQYLKDDPPKNSLKRLVGGN